MNRHNYNTFFVFKLLNENVIHWSSGMIDTKNKKNSTESLLIMFILIVLFLFWIFIAFVLSLVLPVVVYYVLVFWCYFSFSILHQFLFFSSQASTILFAQRYYSLNVRFLFHLLLFHHLSFPFAISHSFWFWLLCVALQFFPFSINIFFFLILLRPFANIFHFQRFK